MDHYAYKDFEHLGAVGSQSKSNSKRFREFLSLRKCRYCDGTLQWWKSRGLCYDEDYMDKEPQYKYYAQFKCCVVCGWWVSSYADWGFISWGMDTAILKKFDLGANDAPLEEIKRILKEDWRYSKHLSAQRAEDLVASVFREHLDCEVLYLTNGVYAPDKGIDFVLVSNEDGSHMAFQVKRRIHDKPEPISEVRAFIGALALSRYEVGYYVTTAEKYTRNVEAVFDADIDNLARHDLELVLVDGSRIRELLRFDTLEPQTAAALRNRVHQSANWWLDHEQPVADIPESGGMMFDDVLRQLYDRS